MNVPSSLNSWCTEIFHSLKLLSVKCQARYEIIVPICKLKTCENIDIDTYVV